MMVIRAFFVVTIVSLIFGLIFPNASGIFGFFKFFAVIIFPILVIIISIQMGQISFFVAEKQITINTGVLTKRSNSITFSNVLNIECTSGPFSALFALSDIEIWTASPSQITIRHGRSESGPTGRLRLKSSDAIWLKDHILKSQKTG